MARHPRERWLKRHGFTNALWRLEEEEMRKTKRKQTLVIWAGAVPANDDFGRPISNEFIDGRTSIRHGQTWAIMNPESWLYEGIGRLGTGLGQRFHKGTDGKFYKVEG